MPTIIVEKNARPGDSWRKRYKSLCLHDPVWYDHLPYLPFPDHWPVFSPKDKIGDWLEMYTTVMELNYWGSHRVHAARSYDEATQEWTVDGRARRQAGDAAARSSWCFATGVSGYPNMPKYPRRRDASRASSTTPASIPAAKTTAARSAWCIGSNNSAHDICADLWEHGADVTMVQRISTHIARSER